MARNSDKIEIRKIDEIIPYINNPRDNKKAVNLVAESISQFGFRNPIIIDKHNVIIAGHTRYEAARNLGMTEVPCVRADDLTEQQVKAFRIADNKVAEASSWNEDLLKIELEGLDMDMSIFGFDVNLSENGGVEGVDGDENGAGDDNDDDGDSSETRVKLGDIYQLGEHRLICGDSTDAETVARLMDGQRAKMLFTSPPYSDMRTYDGGDESREKDLSVNNLAKFISVYGAYTDLQVVNLGVQRKNRNIFPYWNAYLDIAKDAGYKLLAWNVWQKNTCGSIGNQDALVPIAHEWIFVFGRGLKDARTIDSVLDCGVEHGSVRKLHPAVFPEMLPKAYIEAMTDKGDIVIEPFGGSGTTMIVCEKTGRRCFICELDEHFADVIIERWERETGKRAVKL